MKSSKHHLFLKLLGRNPYKAHQLSLRFSQIPSKESLLGDIPEHFELVQISIRIVFRILRKLRFERSLNSNMVLLLAHLNRISLYGFSPYNISNHKVEQRL